MKVSFISLGCAKNLVNTEQMMALCRDAGKEHDEERDERQQPEILRICESEHVGWGLGNTFEHEVREQQLGREQRQRREHPPEE